MRYREIIEAIKNDDDMFGSSTRPDSKVIAQDLELWLRRRQSSSRRPIIPSSENYVKQVIAAFNQSFLKGVETWREYPLYGNTDIKYDIREYLENSLSVNLMDYVDQVNENDESDEDLFGDGKQRAYVVTAPDDEMFGTSASAGQRMIYTYGKQLLHKLEQAYNNPQIKQEYRELTWNEETDEPLDRTDTDAQFQLVVQATGAEFGKALVVDSIVREFAGGMEGLNDFGWMIDDGIFNELTNGWEEFGRSTDVANEDWFRKDLQTFMGDR